MISNSTPTCLVWLQKYQWHKKYWLDIQSSFSIGGDSVGECHTMKLEKKRRLLTACIKTKEQKHFNTSNNTVWSCMQHTHTIHSHSPSCFDHGNNLGLVGYCNPCPDSGDLFSHFMLNAQHRHLCVYTIYALYSVVVESFVLLVIIYFPPPSIYCNKCKVSIHFLL